MHTHMHTHTHTHVHVHTHTHTHTHVTDNKGWLEFEEEKRSGIYMYSISGIVLSMILSIPAAAANPSGVKIIKEEKVLLGTPILVPYL